MQNARSELEHQSCPPPTYTAAERRAQRVAPKSQGFNKPGNLKRKVRAARNAKDKKRLAESEARGEELKLYLLDTLCLTPTLSVVLALRCMQRIVLR